MFDEVFSQPHGLVVLAGPHREQLRAGAWEALSKRCESVYFIGPLPEKPVLHGGARVWLLECTLEERAGGVREVLRLDAHGIVIIGSLTNDVLEIVVHACLSGSLCLLESDAANVSAALEALRATPLAPLPLVTALMAIVTEAPWVVSDEGRKAFVAGAPGAEIAAL